MARGGLENVAYGLYCVPDSTPDVLSSLRRCCAGGAEAFLHGESVLALFGLADVNPRQINIAARRSDVSAGHVAVLHPRLPGLEVAVAGDELVLDDPDRPAVAHSGWSTRPAKMPERAP